jgi:Na+-transporting methylmalonyl-CoA/oxaloacetate decarboxylase gamma subunit
MNVFGQALEVTAIGMVLVFFSLLVVAGLIWALSKLMPGRREERSEEQVEEEAMAMPVPVWGSTGAHGEGAHQAAAIAVAIVRHGLGAARAIPAVSRARTYPAMPWERPAEMWGDAELQGETVFVINADAGSGNWKSRGRLAQMQ